MQYKKFKDAAALLEARAEEQSQRLPRQPIPLPANAAPPPVKPVELWDLGSAFGRLMRETLALQGQTIAIDETPLHVYMEMILQRLHAEKRLPFSALFTPPYTRGRLVGLVRFEDKVQEVFAVAVLPHRFPELVNEDPTLLANSFVVPTESLHDVADTVRARGLPQA